VTINLTGNSIMLILMTMNVGLLVVIVNHIVLKFG
jgi:hypothetical protein